MGHKSFLNESSLNIRETEGLSGVRELNLRVGSRDRRSQQSSGTNVRSSHSDRDLGSSGFRVGYRKQEKMKSRRTVIR